jgi:hypothetical protein
MRMRTSDARGNDRISPAASRCESTTATRGSRCSRNTRTNVSAISGWRISACAINFSFDGCLRTNDSRLCMNASSRAAVLPHCTASVSRTPPIASGSSSSSALGFRISANRRSLVAKFAKIVFSATPARLAMVAVEVAA